MSASRVKAQNQRQNKSLVNGDQEQRARTSRSNRVLAERNQAVAAVGAWVEDGHDFEQHPSTLASITEKLQTERRRQNEESLRRFQTDVRHRVALQTQLLRKRQQLQNELVVIPGRRTPEHLDIKSKHVPLGDKTLSRGGTAKHKTLEQSCEEASEGMRLIRRRLADCRHRETASDLPGGNWNMSQHRHQKSARHVVWKEQEAEDDARTMEDGDCLVFSQQHKCPLVQHRGKGHVTWDSDKLQPDSESSLKPTKILWPMNDQEELKRQWQSRFWMQRRQFMDHEREQVKENMQHRKHLKRTERIKAEKEQIRLEEEKKLEGARQLAAARHMLEERELLILERLKLEEEERTADLQRRKKEEKQRETSRYVDALRAQVKERLSQEKLELPPLCCCASSFWDSHPDTCANNCVFYNNPKAYAQALHSGMMSLGLR